MIHAIGDRLDDLLRGPLCGLVLLHRPHQRGAGLGIVQMLDEFLRYHRLRVIHRPFAQMDVEPVGEVLQQPDAFGVHTGGRQVDDLGDAVLPVRAGGRDIGQVHVGTHVHAQRIGHAVHHLTDPEAAGSRAQVQHADAHDHTGFGGDAGLCDRPIPIAFDVLHIQRDGVGVVVADGCGGAIILCAAESHPSSSTARHGRTPEPPVTRTDGEYRSHGLYGMRTRAVICSRSSRTMNETTAGPAALGSQRSANTTAEEPRMAD